VNAWLPFVISGVVVGSVYAIAAMGLVVTYRTTGLFNFAHGAVGMVVAYAFYQLRTEWHVPTALAIAIALLFVAPVIGVLLDRLLFRSLERASQAAKIVVTMGLLVALQGGAVALFGARPKRVEAFLPTSSVRIASVYVGYDQMLVVAIAATVLAGLIVFFRTNRLGLVMRAVVDDRELAEAAGFPVGRVTGFTWALGVLLAGLAGILFSPLLGLDTITLTLLVLQAMAAAVVGGLTSLPRTVAAAVAIGVVVTVSLKALREYPDLLGGLRTSLPFLVLFAVLVLARRGSLRELGVSSPWTGLVRAEPEGWKVLAVVLIGFALIVPDTRVFALGTTLVLACSFLSLNVLIGSSGLISLTHAGLVGTGAFAYIHFTKDLGLPFPVALLLAGMAAVPLGLAIAIPALRLPGLFLALATFGVGQLRDGLVFSSWKSFSGGIDGLRGSRPDLLTGDRAFAVFLSVMVVLFVIGIGALRRSGLGRALVAMRDSQAAASSLGLDPLWPRVAIFVVSAFLAGVAGGLYAGHLQVASKTFFSTFTSLLWVTVVVVGGVQSVYGALAAAFLLQFVPDLVSSGDPSEWLAPLFGIGAVLLATRPGGLVGLLGRYRPSRLVARA
jgi:branched-subunit amino acid ABC-type transport system permease component